MRWDEATLRTSRLAFELSALRHEIVGLVHRAETGGERLRELLVVGGGVFRLGDPAEDLNELGASRIDGAVLREVVAALHGGQELRGQFGVARLECRGSGGCRSGG